MSDASSSIAAPAGLPQALTQPLAAPSGELARMPRRTRALAEGLIDRQDVFLVIRTGTKVDVASWLARGRVWLVALEDSLVVVATGMAGPRPLAERIGYERLRESQYNHVTGQLALSPAKLAGVRGLNLPPIEGCQMLAQIYRER
ncbi:MAG: hypothetical protein ISS78_06915 [Phycisphaerae bacterium]|nr:hypothetical protein [Phycisphaerae bacterium]